ncbi:diguanylate cyclase domain-containing protein [Rubrivivax sp. A210]|uniref:diguanylate cyclase domain-containing protein n=1 Tax=Rubrivivax sp. A210 TaxID=2772301 RepID=UPI001F40EC90|nr:diguanylate cyclase [Rubrivivax sp. A210]
MPSDRALPAVRRNVLLLLAMLLAALWSTVLWTNARSEAQGLEETRRETAALALLFANHTASTFRNVDHALLYLRDIWVYSPGEFARQAEIHQRFLGHSALQTSVVATDGRVVYSSPGLPEALLFAADREHIQVSLQGQEDRLFVSRPLRGRVSGKWSIQLARPILDGARRVGVIVVSVDPDFFVNFYAAAGLGSGGAARMIRDTGEVMARSSEQEKYVGKVVKPSPYADPGAPQQGSFRRLAQVDGVDRLSSYYRLPEYGLTVVIGPSVDERLAPVRRAQREMLAIAAVVSLVLLAMGWQLWRNISRREEARQQLRDQQERLKLATRHSGIGIWEWDLAARALVWDDAMLALYGLERAGFDGSHEAWRATLHPADRERVDTALRAAMEGRTPVDTEFRIVWPDGQVRHIRSVAKIFRDDRGEPLRVLGTNVDVSDGKATEDRLRLAASVFTHAREGITITDGAGALIEVNQTFTDITGFARAEALGRRLQDFRSGRQGEDFYAAMWRDLVANGQWSGEVWMRRRSGESYAVMLTASAVRDEAGELQHCVGLFTDITSMKERQNHLEHRANYDALTSLPRRELLADRLQQAIAQSQRRGTRTAVVFVDLDGFKAVNDRHGHDAGDELLVAVAERMRAALREGDTLARVGGDEFVAVLPDLDHARACASVLERLLQAVAQPVRVAGIEAGLEVGISASLGVALYPGDAATAEALLAHADRAMYAAKHAGGNSCCFHDDGLVSRPGALVTE